MVYRTVLTSSVLIIVPETGCVDPLGNVDALGQLMDVLRYHAIKVLFDKKLPCQDIAVQYCKKMLSGELGTYFVTKIEICAVATLLFYGGFQLQKEKN